LLSVGFNALVPIYQAVFANFVTKHIVQRIGHPNAGLPNAFGEYDETPEMQALSKNISMIICQYHRWLLRNNTSTHQINCRYRQEYKPRVSNAVISFGGYVF
jgi:hypothetical protein